MKVLNNEEMMNVVGGAFSIKLAGFITGVLTGIAVFLIGVWDGYINPNKC